MFFNADEDSLSAVLCSDTPLAVLGGGEDWLSGLVQENVAFFITIAESLSTFFIR